MNSGNKVSIDIYKSLVTSLPYGLVIINNDKEFLLANGKVIDLNEEQVEYYRTHRTPEDIGLYSLDKSTLCKKEELPIDIALKGGIVKNKKYFIKNIFVPNGLYIKLNAFPIIHSGAIVGATLIYEDITEEQNMYDTVIKSFNEISNHLRSLIDNK